jgi:hypothetical protein
VLDNSEKLDVKCVKNLLKTLFKNREKNLEEFSLNFCPKVETKINKILNFTKFTSLTSLHAIDVEFTFEDLTLTLDQLDSLKSIAFSLNEQTSSPLRLRSANPSFKSVNEVKLCIGPKSSCLFIQLFEGYFNNLNSLHVFYVDKRDYFGHYYLGDDLLTARNKCKNLQQLLFNDRINLSIDLKSASRLASSLTSFNLRISLSEEFANFSPSSFDQSVKFFGVSFKHATSSERPPNGESFMDKYLQFFDERLVWIKLVSASVIESWNISAIQNCRVVTRIDLKTVHIHSGSSICRAISTLERNELFFLVTF